jgi:hypothetical protein
MTGINERGAISGAKTSAQNKDLSALARLAEDHLGLRLGYSSGESAEPSWHLQANEGEDGMENAVLAATLVRRI